MSSVTELMNLSGRKALVTGAVGHIGREVCAVLVELGARVGVLDRDETACREYADELLRGRREAAYGVSCDLADEGETRLAVRHAIERMKGLDILIHCAAYVGTVQADGWAVPFEQQGVKAWDAALRVNLTAPFVMVQEARESLVASKRGSVIFFGSIYGLVGPDNRLYEGTGMANPAGYGASKGSLVQLTRTLATSLAPHVRVNCISPGGVWREQPEAFVERYVDRTPLRRMAREEDLKGAVAYLASDLSAYVTGHNLVVDGGWTAW